MATSLLAEWDNFYVIAGSSAGGLTGLTFVVIALASDADTCGFDTLWLSEHLLVPARGNSSKHPSEGVSDAEANRPDLTLDTELTDPMVVLGAAAAVTRRIGLATGIYVAPLRHPLVTARAAATVQALAAGRFTLGIGAGWLRDEFNALGVPFDTRGAAVAECVTVLRQALAGGLVEHHGDIYKFDACRVCTIATDVPIVLGGNSPAAMRRAAMIGDGWYASGNLTPSDAERLTSRMRVLLAERGRTSDFTIWTRIPRGRLHDFDRYLDRGIDNVIVWADELWPRTAEPTDRRAALGVAARGLHVNDSAA